MALLLKHGHLIIDGQREFIDGAVLIDNHRIKEVFAQTDKIKHIEEPLEVIDLGHLLLMPGFFDSHTHGTDGYCFDDLDLEQMDALSFSMMKRPAWAKSSS